MKEMLKKVGVKLDNFFGITKAGSNVRTEIVAGVTTFMTMCYILMVNAGMFSDPYGIGVELLGVSYGAIYIATALSAIIGTLIMGLVAKLPFAQATGMGLNAFFVYTVCLISGMTYAAALVIVLISGLLFLALTVLGLREKIFQAIPQSVRAAIPAGIGLFIAFIGMQNVGIIVDSDATLVDLHSLNFLPEGNQWGVMEGGSIVGVMPILVCFITFILIAVLSAKKVKGSVFIGMLGGTALWYILAASVSGYYDSFNFSFHIGQNFEDFGTQAVGQVFANGFTDLAGTNAMTVITAILAFAMVDMFDTIGTLYGAATAGDMLDENGNVPNMRKAMLADSIATCAGAIMGTSTVTTFVESSAGVAEGGRTGLTSVVVAILFFIAIFLSPLAELIPSVATGAALMYVGVLMIGNIKNVDFSKVENAVPAFLTLAMMALTYNISYGIALGLISDILIKLCTGKFKQITVVSIVISVLFVLMFFLSR